MAKANVFEGELVGLARAMSRPSLLAFGVGIAALLAGTLTYGTLTGLVPYRPSHDGLIGLVLINFILALTLGALIAWRLTRLWAERRSGMAGARLHIRLVGLFALIAVVPAILVAAFA